MATFVFSKLLRGQLSILDVQNATLAGGVAMGAACDKMIHPGSVNRRHTLTFLHDMERHPLPDPARLRLHAHYVS